LTTSACSLFTRDINTIPLQVEIAQPSLPAPLQLQAPYFYVVTNDNLPEFLKEMKKQSGSAVFIGITIADYEILAGNIQELKRYINELGQVVVYYKTVTVTPD